MLVQSERFLLYGTSACHLCEQAQEMLEALQKAGLSFNFDTVDISESDTLFERYGLRIPVLADAEGAELDWPFALESLHSFLQQGSAADGLS